MELSEPLSRIRIGHLSLVICCIFYLIWWSITFHPEKTYPSLPKYILFVCIAAAGVTGLFFLIRPLGDLTLINRHLSDLIIGAAGIALYIILLILTSRFLHRQVTTELFLIIGWAVLELCVLSSVYGAGGITFGYAAIMSAIVLAAAAISMVCYLAYYNLKPLAGFYDGMVPLILFALVMAVQAILIKVP